MKTRSRLMALLGACGLVVAMMPTLGGGSAQAAELPSDFQLDSGSGYVATTDVKLSGAVKAEALAAVKKWRQDALDTNVPWPKYNSQTTMKQYLAEKGISEADYLQPKWSYELEKIALQRAVEAADSDLGHNRPDGSHWFDLNSNGVETHAEVLAWGRRTVSSSVDQWACTDEDSPTRCEKKNYLTNNGSVTGHYIYLIDPKLKAYGIAGYVDPEVDYGAVWAGEANFSIQANQDELNLSGTYSFVTTLTEDRVKEGYSPDKFSWSIGDTGSMPTVKYNYFQKRYSAAGTWSSDNPAIATVTADGDFKAVKAGSTTFKLTANGRSLTFPVTVAGDAIAAVTNPEAVTVASGTAPTLPKTVSATYESGKTMDVAVTWDAIPADKYKVRAGGSFTVEGHVAGWNKPVAITVNVTPATVTDAVVKGSDHVTTPAGTAPTLPTMATLTWSNGDTTEAALSFPASDKYKAREGGEYTLNGTADGWDKPLPVTVTVTPATVTKVEPLADVTTIEKKAPTLPSQADFTWSNGDKSKETITWETIPETQYASAGTFMVNGTALNQKVTVKVNVVTATVTNVAPVSEVTTESGVAPTLPASTEVTWSNGQKTTENIAWDAITPEQYSPREGGSFTVTGTVAGESITVQVKVNPATIGLVTVDPTQVETESGTAPKLPETATVAWSNGESTSETIAWAENNGYTVREGGSYDQAGTVLNGAKAVSVKVTVKPAKVVKVEEPRATTTVGTAPQLPNTLKVTWSNGDVTDEAVEWNMEGLTWDTPAEGIQVPGTLTALNRNATALVDVTEKPAELKVALSAQTVMEGDQITFTASGFKEGEAVTFTVHSDPITVATVDADANGVASTKWTVPDNFAGEHTVIASGRSGSVEQSFTVKAKAPTATGAAKTLKKRLASTGFAGGATGILALAFAGAGALAVSRKRH